MNKEIKEKIIIFLFILMIIIGLSFILYPIIGNLINANHYQKIINTYQNTVSDKTDVENDKLLVKARQYNSSLSSNNIVDVFQNPNQSN